MGLKPAPGPIGPDLNKCLGLDDPPDCSRPGVQIPSPRGEGKGEGELPSSEPATFNLAAPSPDGQSGSDGEGKGEGELTSSKPATFNPQPETDSPPLQPSITPPLPCTPAEQCHTCADPLPPLLPNGKRPARTCPRCGIPLFPPGTTLDQCPICEANQAILPTGERHSTDCTVCRQTLP